MKTMLLQLITLMNQMKIGVYQTYFEIVVYLSLEMYK